MDDKALQGLAAIRPRVSATVIAQMYGLSRDSVERYARRGTIPYLRIGKLLRFDPVEVDEALRHATQEQRA